jgi:hypothetical protein
MEYPKYDPNQPPEERIAQLEAFYEFAKHERLRKREWVANRYKELGYKSLAQFCKVHNFGVTAGTVGNYLKGNSTMPLWFVPKLCYALLITPNDLLAGLGLYDPSKVKVENNG